MIPSLSRAKGKGIHAFFILRYRNQIIPTLAIAIALFFMVFFSPAFIKRSATSIKVDLGFFPADEIKDRNSLDGVIIRRLSQELQAQQSFLSRFQSRTYKVFNVEWYEGETPDQAAWCRVRYVEDFGSLDESINSGQLVRQYRDVTSEIIHELAEKSKSSPISLRDLTKYGCQLEIIKN